MDFSWILGDIDTKSEREEAEKRIWSEKTPVPDDETVKLLYDFQLKAYAEALESYRAGIRQFDSVIVFCGASVAWLSTFISSQHAWSLSRGLGCVAALAMCSALCLAFLGRRALTRPSYIGLDQALQTASRIASDDTRHTALRDWITRTLFVNCCVFKPVINRIATSYAVAAWVLLAGIAFTLLAVVLQAPKA